MYRWIEQHDDSTNLDFYYNVDTHEYRWDKPADLDYELAVSLSTMRGSVMTGVSPDLVHSVGKEWFTCMSSTNSLMLTGTHGLDAEGLPVLRNRVVRNIGNKWQEKQSLESSVKYYQNVENGELRWSLSPRAAR